MKFRKNDIFTFNGQQVEILDLLGEGGQGEVYLTEKGGERLALKIYKEDMGEDFRYNLKHNAELGSPAKVFLWPKDVVEWDDGDLGYFMDLRPSNFVSFVSFLTGKNAFESQALLLRWCIELCMAFKKLHEKGFSYQDLNDGSFFLDPKTGDLLICDNDNVTADKKNLGILGKMRYMAPEIVRGDKDLKTGKRQLPDVHSDRFSLAVILFMALCLGNPYEGARLKDYDIMDEKAEYEMFGENPVFVYHKTDKSNRPIRGYHSSVLKRWAYLPIYIKEAFHRTFVDGLSDRENERTTALEWVKLLSRYRDELVTCFDCEHQFALGLSEKQLAKVCPLCGKKTGSVCILNIGRQRVVLQPQKKVYETHLNKYSDAYNEQAAEVVSNKNNPSFWGIRLRGDISAVVSDCQGVVRKVAAGGVIPIIKDLQIEFNDQTKGQIVLWKKGN